MSTLQRGPERGEKISFNAQFFRYKLLFMSAAHPPSLKGDFETKKQNVFYGMLAYIHKYTEQTEDSLCRAKASSDVCG